MEHMQRTRIGTEGSVFVGRVSGYISIWTAKEGMAISVQSLIVIMSLGRVGEQEHDIKHAKILIDDFNQERTTMKKKTVNEQVDFEKNYITEALADIRVSVDTDSATIETHAKAYIAMLRLKERWNCYNVDFVFTWLRHSSRRSGPALKFKERFGRTVFKFLKQQPIPNPTMSLDEYRKLWNLYIHPELAETVSREGRFFLTERPLLVTRITADGLARTFLTEGPWQLYDSYLEALRAKEDLLHKIIEAARQRLRDVNEEICKEGAR